MENLPGPVGARGRLLGSVMDPVCGTCGAVAGLGDTRPSVPSLSLGLRVILVCLRPCLTAPPAAGLRPWDRAGEASGLRAWGLRAWGHQPGDQRP